MAEADRVAEDAGLGHALHTPAGELSHGDRRQLELGMASVGQPQRLLLDEPAAGLSPAERDRLLDTLRSLPRTVTLFMIEHDVDMALGIADRVTVMHRGGSPRTRRRRSRRTPGSTTST
jgi:branched-chain amino acid transport system ATP-binding protein